MMGGINDDFDMIEENYCGGLKTVDDEDFDEDYEDEEVIYPGKRKCELLKQIRREIAEANGIVYLTAECTHKGPCKGTCPMCDAEIKYLENELNEKAARGEKIRLVGLSLDSFNGYLENSSYRSFNASTDLEEDFDERHMGRMEPEPLPSRNEEHVIEDGHMPKFYRNR